jgi:hypothetical protein
MKVYALGGIREVLEWIDVCVCGVGRGGGHMRHNL